MLVVLLLKSWAQSEKPALSSPVWRRETSQKLTSHTFAKATSKSSLLKSFLLLNKNYCLKTPEVRRKFVVVKWTHCCPPVAAGVKNAQYNSGCHQQPNTSWCFLALGGSNEPIKTLQPTMRR